MRELIPEEVAVLEESLFPHVQSIVRERPKFPWHRDANNVATAAFARSSQALAIELFETVRKLDSCDAILASWLAYLEISMSGPWEIEVEHSLSKAHLREPRPTQIDALATSPTGVVAFECKFTEQDGGGCSQPKPIAGGMHIGMTQYNRNYEDQTNPVNGIRSRCALSGS